MAYPQWHCRPWVRAWPDPVPAARELAAGTWRNLEALPDPRSPQGRVYPLACLIAIALCAFTLAGNDRLTAVGQWITRASQADLARLHAPCDPMAGRYRAPDAKTIGVVQDRLDPRALAWALLGPLPGGRQRPGGPQRIAAGQLELALGLDGPGSSGLLPITSSKMSHLVDAAPGESDISVAAANRATQRHKRAYFHCAESSNWLTQSRVQ